MFSFQLAPLTRAVVFALLSATAICLPHYAAAAPAAEQGPAKVKISINNASAEALADAMNGVGLKKAEAIVAWRSANGNFTSLDQLTEVKGIGEATLAKNRERLTL